MADGMDIDADVQMDAGAPAPAPAPALSGPAIHGADAYTPQPLSAAPSTDAGSGARPTPPPPAFREIPVKVHIRRPDRDNWTYLGRAVVAYEPHGPRGAASRVVVRAAATHKVMAIFDGGYELQAEKRGNFVVISSVEGVRVVSWSLNALNNSETLRLLTIIELACPHSGRAPAIDAHRNKARRVDRVIKDDRRRRHKRRKDADSLVDAFARSNLEPATPVAAT